MWPSACRTYLGVAVTVSPSGPVSIRYRRAVASPCIDGITWWIVLPSRPVSTQLTRSQLWQWITGVARSGFSSGSPGSQTCTHRPGSTGTHANPSGCSITGVAPMARHRNATADSPRKPRSWTSGIDGHRLSPLRKLGEFPTLDREQAEDPRQVIRELLPRVRQLHGQRDRRALDVFEVRVERSRAHARLARHRDR